MQCVSSSEMGWGGGGVKMHHRLPFTTKQLPIYVKETKGYGTSSDDAYMCCKRDTNMNYILSYRYVKWSFTKSYF